jgi:hypothetical protein
MTIFEIAILSGFTWAITLVVWVLASITSGARSPLLVMVAYVYEGFNFTTKGIVKGAAWAFADGFVTAYLITYLLRLMF